MSQCQMRPACPMNQLTGSVQGCLLGVKFGNRPVATTATTWAESDWFNRWCSVPV
jgi:hypothetical protein